MWEEVQRIAAWLDEEDAANPKLNELDSLLLRMLKVGEEFGELTAAVVGYTGQNPRKGVTHHKDEVAAELADVVLAALVALAKVVPTEEIQATIHNHVLEVFNRAGLKH